MKKDLTNYRKSYQKSALSEDATGDAPMELFNSWFQEVEASGLIEEPNVMSLATTGVDGFPKSRIVLLKGYSRDGFLFFTNYSSEKGKAIVKDPRVCLSFFWPELERQVIVKGEATKVSSEISDTYFQSRPRGSQLGAVVSKQSDVISSRQVLEDAVAQLQEKLGEAEVTRPDHWGGYIVKPVSIEFWQGRKNRLHDRIRYVRLEEEIWKKERLSP